MLSMPEEPDRPTGMSDEEWDKTQAEADIAQFKNAVEDATVEEVDEPVSSLILSQKS